MSGGTAGPCWQLAGNFAAGDRLDMLHEPSGHDVSFLIEPVQGGGLMLALPERPYHRLHAASQKAGALYFKQTRGHAAALWRVEPSGPAHVRITPVRKPTEAAQELWLALDGEAKWTLQASACDWRLRLHEGDDTAVARGAHRSVGSSPPDDRSDSGTAAAADLATDGYCLIRRLVPNDKVRRALRFLNHHLGSADLPSDIEPEGLGVRRHGARTLSLRTGNPPLSPDLA